MTAARSSCITSALASLLVGCAVASCSSTEQQPAAPSSTPTAQPQVSVQPFETQDGFAWLTAACGSPSAMNAAPNGWMPGTQHVRLCLTPTDRPGVLVGVYDDPSASNADLKGIEGQRGYATRQDSEGRTWVFMVDSPDSALLKPLERYGFVLH